MFKRNPAFYELQGTIIQMVGKEIPSQLCGQIPSLVNERINSKLGGIPQSISLAQILQIASSSFDLNSLFSGLGSSSSSSDSGQVSSITLCICKGNTETTDSRVFPNSRQLFVV